MENSKQPQNGGPNFEEIQKDFKSMHLQRKILIGLLVLGALGTFMPWASFMGQSVSGTQGDGWFTFFLFLGSGYGVWMDGKKSEMLDAMSSKKVWIPAGLAGLFGLWKVIDFYQAMSDLGPAAELLGGMTPKLSFGLWIIILCSAAMVAVMFKYNMIMGFFNKKK